MYKDKKVGLCNTILRTLTRKNAITLIIISIGLTLLVYISMSFKYGNNSLENSEIKLISHRGIHSGHYLAEIDYDELLEGVKFEYKDRCKSILEAKKNIDPDLMWSVSFEDWFIYHNFFKHDAYHFHSKSDFEEKLSSKQSFGVYMDIGGYRPYYQSNSAFFDLCLGWAGICMWSPDLAVDLFGNSDRSCNRINDQCLWRADSKFAEKHSDTYWCKEVDGSIADVLQSYKFMDRFGNVYDASQHKFEIDFISLIIMGAEIDFIKCWPFDEYPVKVWSIRTLPIYESALDLVMSNMGYLKFEHLSFNNAIMSMIYVRRDATYPWTEETKHNFHAEYECIWEKEMEMKEQEK